MSIPERVAACLALYDSRVIEIHDQSVLWPRSHMNPLAVFDKDRANCYPEFRGTLSVAERLGYLNFHPTLNYKKKNASKVTVPWPFLGDLLLFLKDADDVWCVNWTIKEKLSDFSSVQPSTKEKEAKQREKKRARFEVETLYYSEAGIRTVPVTSEEIGPTLACNLMTLYGYSVRKPKIPPDVVSEIEDALQVAMTTGTPPSATLARFVLTDRCTREQGRQVFFRAIWQRKLRVDLFSPIIIDQPLLPETDDVFEFYSDWFARCPT
jgi:hypothetical protein